MIRSRTVPFYLDFISPYSWLALMRSEAFAGRHGVRWEMRPVVYGKLLDAHGLTGPAETPARRRYTFHDIARCAAEAGLRLSGPPAHPFRSLEALRALYLYRDDPAASRLAVSLADACWGEGRSLTDATVLRHAVASVGLDAEDLERRIAEPPVKQGLRRMTEEAIKAGVFGVPTFVVGGELFWGHDRMESLARRLAGEAAVPAEQAERMLARPRAADRKGAPK